MPYQIRMILTVVPDEVTPTGPVPEKDEPTLAPTALGYYIQGHPNPERWEPWVVEALRALRPAGVETAFAANCLSPTAVMSA